MPTFRLLAASVVVVVLAFVPTRVQADTAETKFFYWPSSSSFTGSTWTSSMFGVDFRDTFASRWGMHVQYGIGNQSGFGGSFAAAGANAGTDTVYLAEIVHEWQLSTLTLRASGGYGFIQSITNIPGSPQFFRSQGVRLGTDLVFPIMGAFSVQAGSGWYPSNPTTLGGPGGSFYSSASASDWSVSMQYTDPTGGWLVEGGYRQLSANGGSLPGCPCTLTCGGSFVSVGYRVPLP